VSAQLGLVRACRPRQWLKNVLVFAAPGAAGVITHAGPLGRSLLAFAAFCAAASATYLLNDVADVEADRRHPVKRLRPIAAGTVSVRLAQVASGVLLVVAVLLALASGRPRLLLVVGGYVALTLAYTFWLKHVAVVDMVAVAGGFILRAVAGAVAVPVRLSDWFLIFTSFSSLLIVAGKRYAELNELGAQAGVRATLETYTRPFLQLVLGLALATTTVAYCLWAFEKAAASDHGPWFQLSIVPMVTALLRYTLLLEAGQGSAPEDVFLSDRTLQVLGVVWLAMFAIGVHGG
jgi:decaprenyl-phosphate phosphoribosyltransferase